MNYDLPLILSALQQKCYRAASVVVDDVFQGAAPNTKHEHQQVFEDLLWELEELVQALDIMKKYSK